MRIIPAISRVNGVRRSVSWRNDDDAIFCEQQHQIKGRSCFEICDKTSQWSAVVTSRLCASHSDGIWLNTSEMLTKFRLGISVRTCTRKSKWSCLISVWFETTLVFVIVSCMLSSQSQKIRDRNLATNFAC